MDTKNGREETESTADGSSFARPAEKVSARGKASEDELQIYADNQDREQASP